MKRLFIVLSALLFISSGVTVCALGAAHMLDPIPEHVGVGGGNHSVRSLGIRGRLGARGG